MTRLITFIVITFTLCFSALSTAVTVEHKKGTFTIDYTPKRVVVLEFSFADALASVGVSPVGIADDKDRSRVLKQVQDIIGDWQSVGTRSQPSLEVIASLKPDLIIADIKRHEAIYKDLTKIAPTLLLPSKHETYENNLKVASIIGKVLGREEEIQTRIAQHRLYMQNIAKKLPKGIELQFSIAIRDYLSVHPGMSYASTVLQALGFTTPELISKQNSSIHTGLEQLLAIDPEYLIIGHYDKADNIVTVWEKEPLWGLLQAVRNDRVFHMYTPNTWSRCRGIMAAEVIAQDLVNIFAQHNAP